MRRIFLVLAFTLVAGGLTGSTSSTMSNLTEGKPAIQSMGPLAFGPDGILFVGDTKSAAIFAVATGDTKAAAAPGALKIEAINEKVAALLGTTADQILIDDMAVNPVSHNAYLAVSRGRGPEAQPVLVRARVDGKLEVVSLDNVKFAKTDLPEAPVDGVAPQGQAQGNRPSPRRESITDIAFVDGRVVVAGLSNEEFASSFRALPYPFQAAGKPTSVEIFHGAHGRFETRAPVRTFAPYKIGNQLNVMAAYTCTPLVQFTMDELKPGAKVKGKTVAELGNRNRPLDMIVYQKDGKNYLLLANSSRGVMKINADEISTAESIVAPVSDTKGVSYVTVAGWTGIDQLDRFDSKNVIVLRRVEGGSATLESMPLP